EERRLPPSVRQLCGRIAVLALTERLRESREVILHRWYHQKPAGSGEVPPSAHQREVVVERAIPAPPLPRDGPPLTARLRSRPPPRRLARRLPPPARAARPAPPRPTSRVRPRPPGAAPACPLVLRRRAARDPRTPERGRGDHRLEQGKRESRRGVILELSGVQ